MRSPFGIEHSFAKAMFGDKYDRDRKGRFARTESRRANKKEVVYYTPYKAQQERSDRGPQPKISIIHPSEFTGKGPNPAKLNEEAWVTAREVRNKKSPEYNEIDAEIKELQRYYDDIPVGFSMYGEEVYRPDPDAQRRKDRLEQARKERKEIIARLDRENEYYVNPIRLDPNSGKRQDDYGIKRASDTSKHFTNAWLESDEFQQLLAANPGMSAGAALAEYKKTEQYGRGIDLGASHKHPERDRELKREYDRSASAEIDRYVWRKKAEKLRENKQVEAKRQDHSHLSYLDEKRRFEMDHPGQYQAARDRLGYTDVKGGHAPLRHGYDTWSYQGRQDGPQNNMYIKSFDASTGELDKTITQMEWEYRHSDAVIERRYWQIQHRNGLTDEQMEDFKAGAKRLGVDKDVHHINRLSYLTEDFYDSSGKTWAEGEPLSDAWEEKMRIYMDLPSTVRREEKERPERLKQKSPVVKNNPFHKGRYTDVHKAARNFVWI